MMKEIEDNTNRWRDILYSWTGRINIVKMTMLLKAIYKFNVIPIKLPMVFFMELEQKIHNLYGNIKDWIAKAILKEKKRAGRINLSDFKLYYKAIVIKTVWCWHKCRNTDRWNKTESIEINWCTMTILFLTNE